MWNFCMGVLWHRTILYTNKSEKREKSRQKKYTVYECIFVFADWHLVSAGILFWICPSFRPQIFVHQIVNVSDKNPQLEWVDFSVSMRETCTRCECMNGSEISNDESEMRLKRDKIGTTINEQQELCVPGWKLSWHLSEFWILPSLTCSDLNCSVWNLTVFRGDQKTGRREKPRSFRRSKFATNNRSKTNTFKELISTRAHFICLESVTKRKRMGRNEKNLMKWLCLNNESSVLYIVLYVGFVRHGRSDVNKNISKRSVSHALRYERQNVHGRMENSNVFCLAKICIKWEWNRENK